MEQTEKIVRQGGRVTAAGAVAGTIAHDLSIEDPRFGAVCFSEAVDLRHAQDFLGAIHFGRRCIEVDSTYCDGVLDRAATVTLYNVFPCGNESACEEELSNILAQQDAELVCYNPTENICSFKVKHFSKYGLFSDDDEEEDEGAKAAKAAKAQPPPKTQPATAAGTGHYGMMESDEEEEEGERSASEEGSEEEYTSSHEGEEEEGEDEEEEEEEEDEEHMEDDINVQEVEVMDEDEHIPADKEEGEEEEEEDMEEDTEAAASAAAAAQTHVRRVVFRPPPQLVIPPSQGGAAQKSASDAGFLLGRTSRVSWGPNGVLCRVDGGHSSLSTVLVQQVVISDRLAVSNAANYEHCLRPLLDTYTEEQQQADASEGEIPHFGLRSAASGVHAAQAIVRRSWETDDGGRDSASKRTMHFALKLVDALWGVMGEPAEGLPEADAAVEATHALRPQDLHMRRRRALLRWLVDYAAETAFVQPPADAENADDETELAELWKLLCADDIAGACDMAARHKDYHLAMLLSQAEGPSAARAVVREQLQEWRETGADHFINLNRLRLYALVAGCMVWPESRVPNVRARLSVYALKSWVRGLLLQLQYGCTAVDGVREAVLGYEKAFTRFEDLGGQARVRVAAVPLPPYITESAVGEDLAGQTMHVCFELLRVYAKNSMVLDAVVPGASSPNPLDHRLGWTLYTLLMSLGVPRMDAVQYHLHLEFAAQLEFNGLWPWAAFVLQHIADRGVREKAVRDLLWRQDWSSIVSNGPEVEFLTNSLAIPLQEIEAAAMMHFKYRFNYAEAAMHARNGNLAADAHNLLVEHLAYDLILTQSFDALLAYLQFLEQSGFSLVGKHGQVFLNYLLFLDGNNKVNLFELARGIAALPASTPRARLCVGEMAAEVAKKLTSPEILQQGNMRLVAEELNSLPLTWTYRMPGLCRVMNAFAASLEAPAMMH